MVILSESNAEYKLPHIAFVGKVIGQNVAPSIGKSLSYRVAHRQPVIDGSAQMLEENNAGGKIHTYGGLVIDEARTVRLGIFFPDNIVKFIG